jgi:cobyrinic acid a,c-diamide synthase
MQERPMVRPAPGLVVAAPRSGSGKTTLTLGLLRALARQGVAVQPMKCGPDYIDPAFHQAAAGRTSRNLDGWAMRPALIDALIASAGQGCDIVVCEALMGLFDGVASEGAADDGSSAATAARTGWPVLLVLDVAGQSQSAGAIAHGFATFRKGVTIGGVVLNRVASDRHRVLASRGIEAAGLAVLGALPRRQDLVLPERHLGLVQAQETEGLDRILDAIADFVEAHVDLAAVRAMARPALVAPPPAARSDPPGQRIALARDAAFSFIYPHLVDAWREGGAEIMPFSPLADEAPDPAADIAWLPGGYPELHAGRLAANRHFLEGLRAFAATRPVHGECGGYMVLGRSLVDARGTAHAMAGLLALETSFAQRRMTLGYRHATALADCPVAPSGGAVRGHEFHYSTVLACEDEPLFAVRDANAAALGRAGSRRGLATGSFFHVIDKT